MPTPTLWTSTSMVRCPSWYALVHRHVDATTGVLAIAIATAAARTHFAHHGATGERDRIGVRYPSMEQAKSERAAAFPSQTGEENDGERIPADAGTSLSRMIARAALQHLETTIPNKCKPKPDNEWTVYAAIVASSLRERSPQADERGIQNAQLQVIASATGTKCTNIKESGCILADCHAEVLARRGLNRLLLLEIRHHLCQRSHPTVVTARDMRISDVDVGGGGGGGGVTGIDEQSQQSTATAESSSALIFPLLDAVDMGTSGSAKRGSNTPKVQFRLKPTIQLHLYISDSPCGDGSIYPIDRVYSDQKNSLSFTGAKVVLSKDTGIDADRCGGQHAALDGTSVAREAVQVLGALRTKSGRSNLPAHLRSCSMSCSDKLVRWGVCGLDGGLVRRWLLEPVRLSSIVVSADPRVAPNNQQQVAALRRAIPQRIHAVVDHLKSEMRAKQLDGTAERIQSIIDTIPAPTVQVVNDQSYANGKASMAMLTATQALTSTQDGETQDGTTSHSTHKRKRKRPTDQNGIKISPCGFAFNWQINAQTRVCQVCAGSDSKSSSTDAGVNGKRHDRGRRQQQQQHADGVEVLVGARGIRQGKKPKSFLDYYKASSRLSRRRLWELAKTCDEGCRSGVESRAKAVDDPPVGDVATTYNQFKASNGTLEQEFVNANLFKGGPLKGWLINRVASDFTWQRNATKEKDEA